MQTGQPYNFSIYYLSEQAVTIEFGNEISKALLQQITAFNRVINENHFPGFVTSVPAYTTISVFYEPVVVINAKELQGADCFEKVYNYLSLLHQLNHHSPINKANQPNVVTIPTMYGGEFGPDIKDVAALNNISAEEVIHLHSAAVYKVFMIGFVPGFAYLGGMSNLLETPRKATPRKAVPAGSVGIAGKQTGIYPLQTPGGWQIIGKTPLTLFDAGRPQPSLLQAGDEVVFKPIDVHEFEHLANTWYADSHY